MGGRRSFLQQFSGLWMGLSIAGCTPANRAAANSMTLTSDSLSNQGQISPKYTCDGANISPQLAWDAPPAGTRSLVVTAADPDAPGGTFVHWVLYDLPPDLRQLPENLPPQPFLTTGGLQGKNSFNRYGYGGPCPPSGSHRYVFQLYALDTVLDLPPGSTNTDVVKAMEGHVLGKAELVGQYRRLNQAGGAGNVKD